MRIIKRVVARVKYNWQCIDWKYLGISAVAVIVLCGAYGLLDGQGFAGFYASIAVLLLLFIVLLFQKG